MPDHTIVNGIDTWTSPNGVFQVWKPASHVLVLKFRGPLYDLSFAHITMDAIRQVVTPHHRPDIFHDWEGMDLYATESRTFITDQSVELMPRIHSVSVLLSSGMVRMGVSMASLRFGTAIHMYTDRNEFEQAIQKAVDSPAGPGPAHTPLQRGRP